MLICVATHVLVPTSLLMPLVDILCTFAFKNQFIAIVDPRRIELRPSDFQSDVQAPAIREVQKRA